MTKRNINPLLKMVLELGPIILFFVLYLRIKDDVFPIGGVEYQGFIVATGVFIPVLLLTIAIMWVLTRKIARMQVVTAILVVLFGGLTIWFNDDRFFKMKPTIVYLIFGGLLGFGLLRRKSYLEYVMEDMLPLEPEGWMILTKRVSIFFLLLAITNEIVWRNMSTNSWVNFKTFGLTGALFLFFISQSNLIRKYTKDSID
tara:strand:+ start:31 stop:630 length:600 start_codon:yes stop_codon:yes gene_type:complete